MKFGDSYSNLLGIKCTKFHLNSLRFDISVVQRLGGQFFYWTRCRSVFQAYNVCNISLFAYMAILWIQKEFCAIFMPVMTSLLTLVSA